MGGCCGTTAAHIRAIAQMAEGKKPRALKPPAHRAYYSGIELVEAEESNRPLIVGERTNVIGSRLFKNLMAEEKWEEATEIAPPAGEERRAHRRRLPAEHRPRRDQGHPAVLREADPQDQGAGHDRHHRSAAMELALTYCQGKSIINSINLEDGEEKFERICPIAKAYGAALIVGSIDEDKLQAQAFTRERKLAVAQRSVELLTEKYGIAPEDIIIDPLVFPVRHRRRELHRRRGRDHRSASG